MKLKIFKNDKLPFVELRYLAEISSCEKMHSHEELTITAIKEGFLNINFKNTSFVLKAGHNLIINSLVSHNASLENICKHGYVLYLNKQFLEKNNLYFNKSYEFFKNNEFIKLCEILLNENISNLEKEEFILSFSMKIFAYKKLEEDIRNDLALQIKNYLDENYLEDLILEDIAKQFHITITHLIRVFKKEFDLPIHSYILNKKVHKVKDLLLTNLPINEIALECGFFDLNHLNKNFKRVFQVTPKQFQKNIKC